MRGGGRREERFLTNLSILPVMNRLAKFEEEIHEIRFSDVDAEVLNESTPVLNDHTPPPWQVKFICSRIKKRRKPRVKIVTLKLC